MKRFLSLGEIGPEAAAELVALARRLEAHPEPAALAGRILGLLFFNPSLRTSPRCRRRRRGWAARAS